MPLAADIARLLLANKAVKVSTNPPFTWASGIKSPIYCDNRLLISDPTAVRKIVDGFKTLIEKEKLEFDVIGGTATAAIPWAAFLAYELGKPMIYIRPKPKDHGAGKQVEGTMVGGARVLIVEDLISTGGSSVASAEACVREYDAKIVGIAAIFSYGFAKAQKTLADSGIPAFSLSNFAALLNELTLADAEKKMILAFAEDPAVWWDAFEKSK